MNVSRVIGAALLCLAGFTSCKKNDPAVAPYGQVTVSFVNEVDGQALELGPMKYTNAAGDKYGVDLLKYYISNFTLVKADGTKRNFGTHELIDASKPESLSFILDSVANGDYTSVEFLLGVDYEHNYTGDQEGDLDPSLGMFWTWSTGYTFFKHEGFFKDSTGAAQPLVFHLATDRALVEVSLPIASLPVAGNNRKLFLTFNLASAYTSPNDIDFDVDNNRMSTRAEDGTWLNQMQINLTNAFSYNKAE
jgi:hypothetical protein